MVQPIDSFYIFANSLGSELDLNWCLPDELPQTYGIFLFKKKSSDLNPGDITNYFNLYDQIVTLEKIPNPTNEQLQQLHDLITQLNSFLSTNLIDVKYFDYGATDFVDMLCDNKVSYYYKIYVRDLDSKELSDPASANAIPKITAEFDVFDSKGNVINTLNWLINSINTNGTTLSINVYKDFPTDPGVNKWILVTRALPGAAQHFFGDNLYELNDQIVSGQVDNEIIEVKWYSRNDIDGRDSLTALFKSYTLPMKRYLLNSGAIEALFNFIGDGIDPKEQNSSLYYSGMLVSVLSDSSTKQGLDVAQIFPDFIPTSPDNF